MRTLSPLISRYELILAIYQVLNTPAQAISVGNDDPLTISDVTVNNLAGNTDSLGHNTDVSVLIPSPACAPLTPTTQGFDVAASDVTIKNCGKYLVDTSMLSMV